MIETKENQREYTPPREIPTTNSIRPIIENDGKVLLFLEESQWTTKYNPAKWMLPHILIDDSRPITREELARIVHSRCGVKIEIRGKIDANEEDSPTLFDRGTTVMRDRTITFRGRMLAGEVDIDPKKASEFWVVY